ncbi:small ribosomal subunit protein S13, mitochondrial isoform X2 [Juglans microcarpa x Juglans regia]|uniref:small ribosomal subunit protein S13, mitochondrial isoform X2 n=1 Tax=Juglans microcarpa x Juglans regia TaxID=2249226 RepID=UPI001B7E0E47|nr:small ribosomal subunit protein S13, mitochondrial isoform X2 [Juglans microcarpa x Juglans regia]
MTLEYNAQGLKPSLFCASFPEPSKPSYPSCLSLSHPPAIAIICSPPLPVSILEGRNPTPIIASASRTQLENRVIVFDVISEAESSIMLGLRASVATVSDIGLRILPNLSLHGVRVHCINIGGGIGEIPDKKRLKIALQQILSELNIVNKLARDLTGREVYSLREELSRYMTGHDLNNQVKKDIGRLMEIQCYRGIRHSQGLPCRGQRTHTNARTWRGKASPVAGKKKI